MSELPGPKDNKSILRYQKRDQEDPLKHLQSLLPDQVSIPATLTKDAALEILFKIEAAGLVGNLADPKSLEALHNIVEQQMASKNQEISATVSRNRPAR